MRSSLAGTLPIKEDLIDVEKIKRAYYDEKPRGSVKVERVSFGTSGHRGIATERTFNELHVAAITQAICDCRKEFGATGPCFVGHDTHLLSEEARKTVFRVLVANGVSVLVDVDFSFMPTPALSHSILVYNESLKAELVDGILLTPSHNPPDNGGIKYNPTNGGPASKEVTERIEAIANGYLEAAGNGIAMVSLEEAMAKLGTYPVRERYVADLDTIIDMKAIQGAKLKVLVDTLGGSGYHYWERIVERYQLPFTIIHNEYDPTFSFMTLDHDGKIRMDCSSKDAMAGVIEVIGEYDLAVGNDPDYDRYGVVTKKGLLPSNHFFAIALWYLCQHRSWAKKVVGKSIVVTDLVDRIAKALDVAVYETPVGFKYFADLLFSGKVCLSGEESAGGSFLRKDGKVWSTDKDGMIMALLAMEIIAVTGKSLDVLYEQLVEEYGAVYYGRKEATISSAGKEALKKLDPSQVEREELAGGKVIVVRNQSVYQNEHIGGLDIRTDKGWMVARPSGTEPLYKIYGESFVSEAHLEELLQEAQHLVDSVIS